MSIPQQTTAPTADRALTWWSVAGLVLLLPTVVVSWILVLASARGSECLMYGRHCSSVPGSVVFGVFWASLAAGVVALLLPRARWTPVRCGVVVVQWCAQLLVGALILGRAV
ncbi:hypothetical protein [Streptomyces sp. NPDC047725]|uniref:hypothetical protein n=1 Tax=Streptomyces sp. NPDC047725 TaxID=3365487 RepID=UPI00371720B1